MDNDDGYSGASAEVCASFNGDRLHAPLFELICLFALALGFGQFAYDCATGCCDSLDRLRIGHL